MSTTGIEEVPLTAVGAATEGDMSKRTSHLDHDTHLIIYGMMDAMRQANAAHARNIPLPTSTKIPSDTGADGCPTSIWLISSAFLTMIVQITTPMRSNKLPMIANMVDTRKASVCRNMPLYRAEAREFIYHGQKNRTNVNNASAAAIVPRSNR